MPANYHPLDTTEIVKSELVFSLQEYYVNALNREKHPWQGLCNEIGFSRNADIEMMATGERWRISDNQQSFLIWNEKGIITVYERMFDIEDRYISDLNIGRVPLDLRHKIRLSNTANIQAEPSDNRWEIRDGRKNYLIWKEDNISQEEEADNNTLTVYERMFDIQYRYASALNRGSALSNNLSTLRNQISLSKNAIIEVLSRNNRWLITDGDNKFIVRKEQNNLNVYKRPTIENCTLEYSYFLEINNDPQLDKWEIEFPKYFQPPERNLITQIRERQKQQLLQFAKQGIKLYCVDATVDWRLVVGLGSEHVQETNMTFHHIYGIPYIPGSAIKGVLRHWWFQELQEQKDFIDDKGEVDETKALKDSDYCNFIKTFGSQEQHGKVKFLDAYPTEAVHFAIDIMNPHYSKYYSGDQPPTDDQDPVPINFLTVEKTVFRFVFMTKDEKFLTKLKGPFQKALELKGVGAKTSVGYGYFDKDKFTEQTDIITDELKRQQEAAEKQRETERLASLSPIEQLAEELNRLTDTPVDENRAVQIYNEQLPSLEGGDKDKIAQALKAYWQRINKWNGGSDKQRRKVMEVKSILGES